MTNFGQNVYIQKITAIWSIKKIRSGGGGRGKQVEKTLKVAKGSKHTPRILNHKLTNESVALRYVTQCRIDVNL